VDLMTGQTHASADEPRRESLGTRPPGCCARNRAPVVQPVGPSHTDRREKERSECSASFCVCLRNSSRIVRYWEVFFLLGHASVQFEPSSGTRTIMPARDPLFWGLINFLSYTLFSRIWFWLPNKVASSQPDKMLMVCKSSQQRRQPQHT
jgi:hypothetical protein